MSKGERTKAELIAVGLQVWRDQGIERVTVTRCASLVGVTHAAALYHFKTASAFRVAVAEQAVRSRDPVIVPQLITTGHDAVASFTPEERRAYLHNL